MRARSLDTSYGTCSRCGDMRPLVREGTKVRQHNRYVPGPGGSLGRMGLCEGSGEAPAPETTGLERSERTDTAPGDGKPPPEATS